MAVGYCLWVLFIDFVYGVCSFGLQWLVCSVLAECAREFVRECVGESAREVLKCRYFLSFLRPLHFLGVLESRLMPVLRSSHPCLSYCECCGRVTLAYHSCSSAPHRPTASTSLHWQQRGVPPLINKQICRVWRVMVRGWVLLSFLLALSNGGVGRFGGGVLVPSSLEPL